MPKSLSSALVDSVFPANFQVQQIACLLEPSNAIASSTTIAWTWLMEKLFMAPTFHAAAKVVQAMITKHVNAPSSPSCSEQVFAALGFAFLRLSAESKDSPIANDKYHLLINSILNGIAAKSPAVGGAIDLPKGSAGPPAIIPEPSSRTPSQSNAPWVEQVCRDHGVRFIYSPKFHPELNRTYAHPFVHHLSLF